jgi:subtilisin family serine protease
MSMGGLPSQAWADAINALYDAGVLVVTAAGNNYANLPSHLIVYPARFNRVVAACGAMANGAPYADLKPKLMAGDYGPELKMATAIAAYTPNVPWARFGEPDVVDFDGAGTSAATPQVAGAAALWIQKHRAAYDAYPEAWMRVEGVRKALFDSAAADNARKGYFGAGQLRAKDALQQQPARGGSLAPPSRGRCELGRPQAPVRHGRCGSPGEIGHARAGIAADHAGDRAGSATACGG